MVKIRSVYEEKEFDGEFNDGVDEVDTTGYIPLNEQVKMIIKGQITVGNIDDGFDDAIDDIDKDVPEEYFEDATDFDTESELSEVLSGAIQKDSRNTSEHNNSSETAKTACEEEERVKQSDDDKQSSV